MARPPRPPVKILCKLLERAGDDSAFDKELADEGDNGGDVTDNGDEFGEDDDEDDVDERSGEIITLPTTVLQLTNADSSCGAHDTNEAATPHMDPSLSNDALNTLDATIK